MLRCWASFGDFWRGLSAPDPDPLMPMTPEYSNALARGRLYMEQVSERPSSSQQDILGLKEGTTDAMLRENMPRPDSSFPQSLRELVQQQLNLALSAWTTLRTIAISLLGEPWLVETMDIVPGEKDEPSVDSLEVEMQRLRQVLQSIDRLVAAMPDGQYQFDVIVAKGSMVNAFAAPGGSIVIYSGLIGHTGKPEEVAAGVV